jgi:(p)ppGpp synthase/HD superfamily hydrolase
MSDDMIERIRISAVLHDVLEDAPGFWGQIQSSFSQQVVFNVAQLSKPDNWSYKDYIDGFKNKRPEQIVVKLADLEDNLSDLPADHSLRKRYESAQKKLKKWLKKAWTE